MKLDFDIIREILLKVEATPANQDAGPIKLLERDEDAVLEHIDLLREKGLIDANIQYAGSGNRRVYHAHVKRLTMAGHEFLANARNEGLWNQTKQLVMAKGGSVSFEVFKALLSQGALRWFGLEG
jgi:hypothetical protein